MWLICYTVLFEISVALIGSENLGFMDVALMSFYSCFYAYEMKVYMNLEMLTIYKSCLMCVQSFFFFFLWCVLCVGCTIFLWTFGVQILLDNIFWIIWIQCIIG